MPDGYVRLKREALELPGEVPSHCWITAAVHLEIYETRCNQPSTQAFNGATGGQVTDRLNAEKAVAVAYQRVIFEQVAPVVNLRANIDLSRIAHTVSVTFLR